MTLERGQPSAEALLQGAEARPDGSVPDEAPDPPGLIVRDLARMPYATSLQLQRQLHADVLGSRQNRSGASRQYLLLVEHDPPVVTVSARKTARQHLIATPAQLASAGVEVAETDRGGDITYHGPGQLVVYPILDLNLLGLRLHGYMRFLEEIVIETLAHFGITGERDPSATGVWVKPKAPGSESVGFGPLSAKICAMGVRVSRWVTMHGLALNVTTDLDHFSLIVPCGLIGRSVTSMSRELGSDCPSMNEVKRVFVDVFRAHVKALAVQPMGFESGTDQVTDCAENPPRG